MTSASRLSRAAVGLDAPRTGIVHFGLGAFHRAHQAWYTSRVDGAGEWGIHAFGNRSPQLADALAEQDGLFTLLERDSVGDTAELVSSIAETGHGDDIAALARRTADPHTKIATLTITEPGYCASPDGALDPLADGLDADIAALAALSTRSRSSFENSLSSLTLTTTPARIVVGLMARQRNDGGPIAFVPCDNMPDNGRVLQQVLASISVRVGGGVAEWLEQSASFVSTSVDRITPASSAGDIDTARSLMGWTDMAPIATEPFSDWVLSGGFPSGRPAWEEAGARFVADIRPWEQRKLWLLNGAHSLLAYGGLLRGHQTVADAIRDPSLRDHVEAFWNEVAGSLASVELDIARYRDQLLHRFENSRIEHRLVQIAAEGSTKLGLRVAPIALEERGRGHSADASAGAYAAWIGALRSRTDLIDARSDQLAPLVRADGRSATRAAIALTNEELAADDAFVDTVVAKAAEAVALHA